MRRISYFIIATIIIAGFTQSNAGNFTSRIPGKWYHAKLHAHFTFLKNGTFIIEYGPWEDRNGFVMVQREIEYRKYRVEGNFINTRGYRDEEYNEQIEIIHASNRELFIDWQGVDRYGKRRDLSGRLERRW